MTKIEAFYERQNEFNKRLEQRVSEHLTKEREDSRAPRNKRLPKELSVSHLAHKNLQVLILFISSLGTLLITRFFYKPFSRNECRCVFFSDFTSFNFNWMSNKSSSSKSYDGNFLSQEEKKNERKQIIVGAFLQNN